MANIHEQLYQSNSFSKMEFDKGLKRLVETILQTLNDDKEINMNFHLEPVQLNIHQAVPCSLIVNEVITNCLKHAFTDRETGNIDTYMKSKNGELQIKIVDDGVGMPQQEQSKNKESIGLELIQTLARQINGTFSYKPREAGEGTSFTIRFSPVQD
jgi:two-component sensor histidine kinase